MFYGWINVLALAIFYALLMAPTFYGFSVLVAPMATSLGMTMMQASGAYSLSIAVTGIATPVAAELINRFGVKRVMFYGSFLFVAAGLIMYYFVNGIYCYYLMFILLGIGNGFTMSISIQTNIAFWFFRFRARAMALAYTGGAFGAAIIVPYMQSIIVKTGNWRIPWLYVAGLAVIGGIVVLIILRDNPAEMGLLPDGAKPEDTDSIMKTYRCENYLKHRVYKSTFSWETEEARKSPTFYMLTVIGIIIFFATQGMVTHSVNHLSDIGISPSLAAASMGIYAISSSGGRLISGFLCDQVEPRLVLLSGLAFLFIAAWTLLVCRTPVMVYVYAITFGLGFGFSYICLPNLVVNYFGTKNFASINGIFMMAIILTSATSAFISGAIRDVTDNYNLAWLLTMGLVVLAVIVAILLIPPKIILTEQVKVAGEKETLKKKFTK